MLAIWISAVLFTSHILAQSASAVNGTASNSSSSSSYSDTLSYETYSTTVTVSSSEAGLTTITSSAHGTAITTATLLSGTVVTSGATATFSASVPSNSPCNGYVEFCERKYSNITMVAAHNSPFSELLNPASNQDYSVIAQLNDGIRMVTGETQLNNGIMHYCHTSCLELDAGPAETIWANITSWLDAHPYEVVAILIVNSKYVPVTDYVPAITSSGLIDYAFLPPVIPMALDDWPTLDAIIASKKRALIFMDYKANQTLVPYVMDQFSQLWETPFSPTDPTFPCTEQRPPGITAAQAKARMYLANHNLNTEIQLFGLDILIPDLLELFTTNAVSGNGSLGAMNDECTADWGRPPNFLLVDYYNIGGGSVFEVAAKANGVVWNNQSCCGNDDNISGAGSLGMDWTLGLALVLAVTLSLV